MKQRIQCARPDAIPMMRQFLHHSQPEDRLVPRMQQHVNANQAVEKFPRMLLHTNHYTAVHMILP